MEYPSILNICGSSECVVFRCMPSSTPFGSARTTIPFYPECPKRALWATLKHTHSGVIPVISFSKVLDSFDNVMYTNATCMGLAFPYGASSYGIHLL